MIKFNQGDTMKVGELYKHFKGTNLIEKNIYEIVACNITYTGDNTITLDDMVIYRPLFQEGKTFAREASDLLKELTDEEKMLYHQNYRIEKLTDEELTIINTDEYKKKKQEYIASKYQAK